MGENVSCCLGFLLLLLLIPFRSLSTAEASWCSLRLLFASDVVPVKTYQYSPWWRHHDEERNTTYRCVVKRGDDRHQSMKVVHLPQKLNKENVSQKKKKNKFQKHSQETFLFGFQIFLNFYWKGFFFFFVLRLRREWASSSSWRDRSASLATESDQRSNNRTKVSI